MIWHILLTHLKQVEILYHDWFNDLKSKHFLRNKMHRHYIQTLLWWLSLQLKTLKFPQDRSEGGSWMFGISPIWGRRSTELKVKTKARPSAFRQSDAANLSARLCLNLNWIQWYLYNTSSRSQQCQHITTYPGMCHPFTWLQFEIVSISRCWVSNSGHSRVLILLCT